MEWFNGGVREAIAAAQTKKTVFVVVITGQISSSSFSSFSVSLIFSFCLLQISSSQKNQQMALFKFKATKKDLG